MIRRSSRPRPLADWRCSPIAPDVPAAVEAAAVAWLAAREAYQAAFGRYMDARVAGTLDDPDDAAEAGLEDASGRLCAAAADLETALAGRRGYHPAGGMLVGLVATRHGLGLKVHPAALSPHHPTRRVAAEHRP